MAVEMPRCVAEHRRHDHQSEDERDTAEDQRSGDDEAPGQHHARLVTKALVERATAFGALMSRSTITGSEIAPTAGTSSANRKPTPQPTAPHDSTGPE